MYLFLRQKQRAARKGKGLKRNNRDSERESGKVSVPAEEPKTISKAQKKDTHTELGEKGNTYTPETEDQTEGRRIGSWGKNEANGNPGKKKNAHKGQKRKSQASQGGKAAKRDRYKRPESSTYLQANTHQIGTKTDGRCRELAGANGAKEGIAILRQGREEKSDEWKRREGKTRTRSGS